MGDVANKVIHELPNSQNAGSSVNGSVLGNVVGPRQLEGVGRSRNTAQVLDDGHQGYGFDVLDASKIESTGIGVIPEELLAERRNCHDQALDERPDYLAAEDDRHDFAARKGPTIRFESIDRNKFLRSTQGMGWHSMIGGLPTIASSGMAAVCTLAGRVCLQGRAGRLLIADGLASGVYVLWRVPRLAGLDEDESPLIVDLQARVGEGRPNRGGHVVYCTNFLGFLECKYLEFEIEIGLVV